MLYNVETMQNKRKNYEWVGMSELLTGTIFHIVILVAFDQTRV